MTKLTKRRMDKAVRIFEEFRTKLHKYHRINCAQMEKELKECLSLNYQAIKGIITDLSARERYKYLACYFMENMGMSAAVVSEYRQPLAKLYGIDSYYADDRQEKRNAFWETLFSRQAAGGNEVSLESPNRT